MTEIRDPAIKLFGKTIALLPADGGGGGEEDKGHVTEETTTASKYREEENPESEENSEHISSPPADDNHKHSSGDQETATHDDEEEEEDEGQSDSSNPLLKKPDKILPCPRCNSLDTKFCYYNNYNVNQPRHFCKNCQRYWTAGGTMRNVPVGAGRRKNKNPVASLYHHPPLKSGGSVLSFGSDAPVCDTMSSCHRNGLHRAEEQPSASSVTPSSCDGAGDNAKAPSIRSCQSFTTPQIPWPFPWNPPPPVCVSSYPMPFHPAAAAAAAAYWGCAPWSLPWLSGSSVSVPDTPALGKHSREEDDALPGESSSGSRRLWIPKTLRIHDPEEAAKSSIWATMGFDKTEGCRGFFKAFQTKGEEQSRTHLGEASQALRANPAALSRSISFLESSQVTDFSSIDAL